MIPDWLLRKVKDGIIKRDINPHDFNAVKNLAKESGLKIGKKHTQRIVNFYFADIEPNIRQKLILNRPFRETKLAKWLSDLKLKFVVQKRFQIDNRVFYIDYYLPDYNIAIEVDGGYHNLPDTVQYDRERTSLLLSMGIKVLRFKNEMIKNNKVKRKLVKNQILEAIEETKKLQLLSVTPSFLAQESGVKDSFGKAKEEESKLWDTRAL